MPLAPPLVRVVHELCVEPWTEALRHHAFDDPRDLDLRVALTINELDRHAGVVLGGLIDDALDLAVDGERLVAAGNKELEQKLRADRERASRLDERAATRDVLGVVGEERVEPLVFDLELDRAPRISAALAIEISIVTRGVLGHASPYQ